MRILSAAAIKAKLKRGEQPHLQNEPTPGTRIREIYDLLKASPGVPVDLKLRPPKLNASGKKTVAPDARAIIDLQDYYGLDIRIAQRSFHRKGTKVSRNTLHILAGEWFGSVYIDYVAMQFDTAKERAMAAEKLPAGVYTLSEESVAALKRAHEKCAATEAKFVKRGA